MAESILTASFAQAVSGVQRRTWNKEEAAAKAREKDALADPDGQAAALAQKIREKPVERNPLSRDQSRDKAGNVDYMGQVGKVKMTTSKAAAKDRVGAFYCPVCYPILYVHTMCRCYLSHCSSPVRLSATTSHTWITLMAKNVRFILV